MSGIGVEQFRIEQLHPRHDRAGFSCAEPHLDAYLQHQARQDVSRSLSRVYILTHDGVSIDGFYSLSSAAIEPGHLPADTARKLPRRGIPATLLGRMAIDRRMQGQSLGRLILASALRAAWQGSRSIGS